MAPRTAATSPSSFRHFSASASSCACHAAPQASVFVLLCQENKSSAYLDVVLDARVHSKERAKLARSSSGVSICTFVPVKQVQ
jgi:hypothetical protein